MEVWKIGVNIEMEWKDDINDIALKVGITVNTRFAYIFSPFLLAIPFLK
jgi:hypothetical protein